MDLLKTATYEAERQAFYDNEQHLKSRIQSLTQACKQPRESPLQSTDPEPEEIFHTSEPSEPIPATKQDMNDPDSEPAEMTALRLELSTLSTSYSSLQSTLVLLQSQLMDLKRVNNQLQEENESYMILLREKTLTGQFDLRKQVGASLSTTSCPEDCDMMPGDDDVGSLCSIGRSTLDRVEESAEEEDAMLYPADTHSVDSKRRHPPRQTRRSDSVSHSPSRAPRGESLADLPVAGPGLDLAAELGRAENKDIDLGPSIDERTTPSKERRKKGSTDQYKVSSSDSHDPPATSNDIDALRMEVKSLKDANKALSLYASKIIDRIIAEEGFEHVLAVDYENSQKTPSATTTSAPKPALLSSAAKSPVMGFKPRPQSTTLNQTPSTSSTPDSTPILLTSPPTTRTQRRSLSFDWRGFSVFGGGEKKAENSTLPKPGASSVLGARKLETYEDEEDRRERERLKATMKLLGIEKPDPSPDLASSANFPVAVPMEKSLSAPGNPTENATPPPSRFAIFRSLSATGASDPPPTQPAISPGLTQDALEQVAAVGALVALDARERTLSEEIAKGGSGGFTELSTSSLSEERRSRRSRRSGGGSGSTVWSAGMKTDCDTDDFA